MASSILADIGESIAGPFGANGSYQPFYGSSNWVEDQKNTIAFNRQKELLGMQQQFNSAEALKDRNFQQMMANTAVQRRSADLKAAGFNPILAVSSASSGAVTPQGSSASSGSGSSVSNVGRKSNTAGILAATAAILKILASV